MTANNLQGISNFSLVLNPTQRVGKDLLCLPESHYVKGLQDAFKHMIGSLLVIVWKVLLKEARVLVTFVYPQSRLLTWHIGSVWKVTVLGFGCEAVMGFTLCAFVNIAR